MSTKRLLTSRFNIVSAVATSLLLLVLCFSTKVIATQHTQPRVERPASYLSADVRVERGIFLLYPNEHSINLQEWESIGIPRFDSLTSEKRLRLAITELQIAVSRQRQLKAYSITQVYSHLGRANTALAQELQRQAESSNRQRKRLADRIWQHFTQGIRFHRAAFQQHKGELKYVFALDLIKAIVSSGNLNLAMETIRDLERENLRPPSYSDYSLIKMKADIYSVLGRHTEAGLTYEEWIRRGKVDSFLVKGNALYEKLQNLQRKTGHPDNLPF